MVPQKMIIILLLTVVLLNFAKARRQSKFFSFNTLDGDVSVDLEFSIPFITIPVKKTMENFGATDLTLPTINVNVAALALGGAVVLGTVVLLPLLIKATSTQYLHKHKPYLRLLDNAHFGSDAVLDFANHLMMDSGGLQRCALRVACWTGQTDNHENAMKILSHVSGNTILSAIVNATAMEEAVAFGRRGEDCSAYRPCPIRDDHMPFLLNNLSSFNSKKYSTNY